MDTPNRLAAWVGNPVKLTIGLLALGIDVATIIGWAAGSGVANFQLGTAAYAGILAATVPLGALFIWAWFATWPQRPSLKFKALHGDIAEYHKELQHAALGLYLQPNDVASTVEMNRVELREKLRPLGIRLFHHDDSDRDDIADHSNYVITLAALASTGDIKTARRLTPKEATRRVAPFG